MLQALLGGLAVGDVRLAADDPLRPPVGVAHGHRSRVHPAVLAVAVLDPVLVLEVLERAGHVRVERLRERGAVVLVHAAEPLAGRVADLGVVVAEHLLPARREVEAVGADVPVPEALVGALERERVALLGLGEAGERGLVDDGVAQRALERRRVRRDEVLGDAGLGRRQVDVVVELVVEQQHRGVRAVGEDRPREVEVLLDQEDVVRVLVERRARGRGRRHPVDVVARAVDRLQRFADRGVPLGRGLHDEHRRRGREHGHGSSAASSQ